MPGLLIRAGSIKLIVFLTGVVVPTTEDSFAAVPVAGSADVQVVQGVPVVDGSPWATEPGVLMRPDSNKLGFLMGVFPVAPTVPVDVQVVQAVPVDAGSAEFADPGVLMRPDSPKIGFFTGAVPVAVASIPLIVAFAGFTLPQVVQGAPIDAPPV